MLTDKTVSLWGQFSSCSKRLNSINVQISIFSRHFKDDFSMLAQSWEWKLIIVQLFFPSFNFPGQKSAFHLNIAVKYFIFQISEQHKTYSVCIGWYRNNK